uniref:Si:dkey-24p1.6 n=1 Tax=Amphiprion percula TaxID=161767 RepID=A0A3P8SK97_AMPPE
FETGSVSTLLLRQWTCVPGDPKIRTVKLRWPDWLVYQADGIVPDSAWVLSCILRASVRYSGSDDTEASIAAQDVATLQPKPFFSRPVKQHRLCIAWTVHLLSSIYASTGENFGITKSLDPYRSEVLEYLRVKANTFPCMFSIWIFVTKYCQELMCGILHHIDSHNNYATPTVFLTDSQLHIQVNGDPGKSSAFVSPFKVPLSEWCRLNSMVCTYKEQRTVRFTEHWGHDVVLDDTEGYLVIGGGKYIPGVEGYFGPVVYYRAVGRALYSLSLHKLVRGSSNGVVSRIFPVLLQAGCLADNRALHLSSVLCSTGLGVQKQPVKAWLLALLAAQNDDRLALLHLGHLHHLGLQGLPADPDLAYAYYANIAKQTTVDRENPTPQQTFVEAVYLNNEGVLNLQTNEDHHIFQWLKLQARRGTAEAEQAIARMLFWGQQGVSPNIQEAARHYRRGAVQLEDPVSMYDYGIILLQGQGVEKDVPKAISFLRKAMDQQGFVPAINALAWYYEQFKQDYKQAVQLWEQGDLLECPEAAFNLGVMYSQGLYPGKAANQLQYMAYKYYLKSAQRGHIRGATFLANIWTTGMPGFVNRRPSDAVWVKWAAEHNGYLGSVLRKALDSYLKNDLLYYMMAAELGYAPAQFNLAYLCEQNMGGFLDPVYGLHCMWRYYNLTIQSQDPDTYAIIRMGDLLYDGHDDRQRDLFSAAQMYKLAALMKNPQGWYNLGLLAEEGYRLPLSILIDLGLSELYLADNSLLLSALYKCRDSEDADSYLPCSLALFHVYLQSFQKDYSAAIK